MEIVAKIADLIGIIPVIIIFFKGFSLDKKVHIYIYVYIFSLLLKNALTALTGYLGIFNIYIYNWYSIISYIIIALLYRTEIKNQYIKMAILISIGVVVGLLYIDKDSFFDTQVIYFSRYSHNLVAALAIVVILIYFYQLIQDLPASDLTQYPLFWFSTGALLYYSGNFFSNLFISSTLNHSTSNRNLYWTLEVGLIFILTTCLSLTVWYLKPAKA